MIEIVIPAAGTLRLAYLVLDYNGTIAEDGELIAGVREKMNELAAHLELHVITADTHGTVRKKLEGLPCSLEIIGSEDQDLRKRDYVTALGRAKTAAVGNGRNDILMLEAAALGISLIQKEGASAGTLRAADIVCTGILDVFDLFLRPARLQATLRN